MKYLRPLFAFVFFFSLEVRVKAHESSLTFGEAAPVSQIPEDCLLNQEYPCSFLTADHARFSYFLSGKAKIVSLEETSLSIISEDQIKLMSGAIFIDAHRELLIKTNYGFAKIPKGQAWVYADRDRFYFEAVNRKIKVYGRGFDRPFTLDPGQVVWLGPVDQTFKADSALPTPIDLSDFTKRMAKINDLSKEEFALYIQEFAKTWKITSQKTVAIHKHLLQRQIASDQDLSKKRKRQRALQMREDRRLRKLFYQKNFLDH